MQTWPNIRLQGILTLYTWKCARNGKVFLSLAKRRILRGKSIELESMKIQRSCAEAKYAQEAEPSPNRLVPLAVHEGLRVEPRWNKVSETRQPCKGRSPQLLQPTRSIPSLADPVSSYNLLPPISANTQAITWAKGGEKKKKKKKKKNLHRQTGKAVSTRNQSWKSSIEVRVQAQKKIK